MHVVAACSAYFIWKLKFEGQYSSGNVKASVLCIFAVGAVSCSSSDHSNYTISTATLMLVNSEMQAFCLCMFPQHYQLHVVSHKEWTRFLLLPFILQYFPFSAGQNCSRYSSVFFLTEFLKMSGAFMLWFFGLTRWLLDLVFLFGS